MSRSAFVDAKSKTVISVHAAIAPDFEPPEGVIVVASASANVGDAFDGAQFHAPPPPALSVAALLDAASAVQERLLASIWSFDVGHPGSPLVVTTRLDQRGQAAMHSLAIWALLNAQDGAAQEAYSNVDCSTATITPGQALLLVRQADAVRARTCVVFNALADGVRAALPTVTTLDQIATAAWPVPGGAA